jgi:dTDP-4-dehydrorhamnose reductase
METHAQGIYHVVGSQSLTPYEATRLIAQKFDQDENLIVGVKRQNYFAGRAERPFKLVLRNDNIEKLGVRMRTFSEGLEEVERQLKARDL